MCTYPLQSFNQRVGSLTCAIFFSATLIPVSAAAGDTNWVDWTLPPSPPFYETNPPTPSPTTYYLSATGSAINPLDGTTIVVTHTGETNSLSSNGWAYWTDDDGNTSRPSASYISPISPNAPVNNVTDIIVHTGYTSDGNNHKLAFSKPVSNIAMALWSFGGVTTGAASITFSQPFVILSSNNGIVVPANPAMGLTTTGNTLTGLEGVGVIQFVGEYNEITWEVTDPEFYFGFNLGFLSVSNPAAETLEQIRGNAGELSYLFNTQASVLQASLSHDCTLFDKHNICVSVGGRYTNSAEESVEQWGGIVTTSYRLTDTSRIGGFVDQASQSFDGLPNINQDRRLPTFGVFANMALNNDGSGLNFRAAAAFSTSDLRIKRDASGLTEGGAGESSFDGRAYEVRADYVAPLGEFLTVSPYIGLRYTHITNSAYTESSTAEVMSPVSYNEITQEAFSLLAGASISLKLTTNFTATVSGGVQRLMNYEMDDYSGTSNMPGLGQFSVSMDSTTETLATAGAALSYDISNKERLSLNAQWQQQPSDPKGTTFVMATWAMGF